MAHTLYYDGWGVMGNQYCYRYKKDLNSFCHLIEYRDHIFRNRTVLFFRSSADTDTANNFPVYE